MTGRTRRTLVMAAALAAPALMFPVARADLTADQTPFHSYRGLWVDRFDFNSAASIRTIFDRAADLGVTDVMIQVRGAADAYYYNNGGLERRASGVSPSYDPLGIAVTEGHARGIKVHAWINAMPLWNGTATPPDDHLYTTRPDFRMKDAAGVDEPLRPGYVTVNPALPAVQTHLNDVARTVVGNYAVDGLHLDYIRLYSSNGGPNNVLEYPADAATVGLFQQQYPGQTPTSHPANYKAWMASRITDLVGSLRTTIKDARPAAQLTAAVWRDADIGLDEYQQDWARWTDSGLLDAAMPMIYRKGFAGTDPGDLYRLNVTEALNRRGTAGVMVGLGTYMQNDGSAYANVIAQLTYARDQGANGVQIFDQGSLYNGTTAQSEARRALQDFFAAHSARPAVTAVETFDAGEGRFTSTLTASGSNRNVAATSTAEPTTAQPRSGAGAQALVIHKTPGAESYRARHLSGGGNYGSNLPVASIGSIGFWLRTTTPDVRVSIALDDVNPSIDGINSGASAPSTGDRSYLQNVIADGQWHRYEWSLADPSHWADWTGSGDGHLSAIVAVDSIHFEGTADVSTIYLDDLFYDPGAVAPNQWTKDGDDAAYHHAGNWTGGVPDGVGAAARFARRASAARTILLDKPATVGSLTFDNDRSYTLAGTSTLTLDVATGPAYLSVINRGAHAVTAPLRLNDPATFFVDRGSTLTLSGTLTTTSAGKAIARTGDGTLILAGPTSLAAGSTLSATGGQTVFTASPGPLDGSARLAVSVSGSASVRFEAPGGTGLDALHLAAGGSAALAAGGGRVLAVNSISFTGGTLDLADGDLVVRSAADPDADLAALESAVRSARNAATGRWTGAGLTSSAARASGTLASLAVVRNRDADTGQPLFATFDGLSVDADDLLVKYTYAGDATLDGRVDARDYFAIDRGRALGRTGWAAGDFDHSGGVPDIADYLLIDASFLAQDAAPLAAAGAPPAASVPEPASLAFASLAAAGLLTPRRRRRARAAL